METSFGQGRDAPRKIPENSRSAPISRWGDRRDLAGKRRRHQPKLGMGAIILVYVDNTCLRDKRQKFTVKGPRSVFYPVFLDESMKLYTLSSKIFETRWRESLVLSHKRRWILMIESANWHIDYQL